ALSSGTEYQIDLDLSQFTYELAAKVGYMPSNRVVDETELADAHRARTQAVGANELRRSQQLRNLKSVSKLLESSDPLVWAGEYRIIASPSELVGVWVSAGQIIGRFTMRSS